MSEAIYEVKQRQSESEGLIVDQLDSVTICKRKGCQPSIQTSALAAASLVHAALERVPGALG